MKVISCSRCGTELGAVNGVSDGGPVVTSEFICDCGQGVRSHYCATAWREIVGGEPVI